MRVDIWVLVINDIANHHIDWADLIVGESYIYSWFTIWILVEKWELIAEVFGIVSTQKWFNWSAVESQIWNHTFEAQLKEDLEEEIWIWLSFHQNFNVTLSLTSIDGLKNEKLSESDFVNFNLENIIEMSLSINICVLFLKTYLSIVIELAGEEQVISRFDLDVIDRS